MCVWGEAWGPRGSNVAGTHHVAFPWALVSQGGLGKLQAHLSAGLLLLACLDLHKGRPRAHSQAAGG